MDPQSPIGLTPVPLPGDRGGIVISGRWPDSTLEWSQTLVASIRIACRPGFLPVTTVFSVRERPPDGLDPDAVGVMVPVGAIGGDGMLQAEETVHNPAALLMLHPPGTTRPSLPECTEVGSGCVLLPGVPELGLGHRAGWAEADAHGTVVNLRNAIGVELDRDPDTAVLGLLLSA